MLMCGGDGLADLVGRKWGTAKLPFSAAKSWAGSAAMLIGGFAFGFAFVVLFHAWGVFDPALNLPGAAWKTAVIALAATVVEALPRRDVENLPTTAVAVALGLLLF